MLNRVTDLTRNVLTQGEELRPVLRYARKHPVDVIRVAVDAGHVGTYAVTFYFADGAECFTRWADWRVLVDWLRARRSWSFHRVRFADRELYAAAREHPGVQAMRRDGVEIAGP